MLKLGPETATNSRVLHHHKETATMAERETERATVMADGESSAEGDQPCWVESRSGRGPQRSLCPVSTGHSPPSGPAVDREVRGHINYQSGQ